MPEIRPILGLGAAFLVMGLAAGPCHAGTFRVVHIFGNGDVPDGILPSGDLLAAGGLLFGATLAGGGGTNCGTGGCGTVFQLDPTSGAEAILHSFTGGTDGTLPTGSLIQFDGALYGTTEDGGTSDEGTVFSLGKTTGEHVTYDFPGGSGGENPTNGLTNVDGTLYGTTSVGGLGFIGGVIFTSNPKTGAEQVVYAFQAGADGSYPDGNLLIRNGLLYGTTSEGGSSGCEGYGCGTVYAFDPATRVKTILYTFQGGQDGAFPSGPLTWVGNRLFGVTYEGGGDGCGGVGCGTVFAVDPASGTAKIVHSFRGGHDGQNPNGGLAYLNGSLYGTTQYGGSDYADAGSIFAIDLAAGTETVAFAFTNSSDGINPSSGLVETGGTLYGTASIGGSRICSLYGSIGCGTVFGYTP